jgi:hypothetical protein
MQINEILNIPENVDIQYLKDNITEDQLLLVYSYILENEDAFSEEQLSLFYDFFYEIDDKLKELDDE